MKNWEALREWMAGKTVRYAGKDWASTWQLGPGTRPSVVGRCLIEHPDGWEVYVEPCTFLDAVKRADNNRGDWWQRRGRSIQIRINSNGPSICFLECRTRCGNISDLVFADYLATDWEAVEKGDVPSNGRELYAEPCNFLDAVKQAKGTRGQWWRRRSRGILFSVTEEGTLRLGTTADLFLRFIADDYLASDWEPVPTGE